MSAPFIDYYEVLHVERGTSVEDINRAFRRQSVLTVHPDKFPPHEKAEAEERSMKLSHARDILAGSVSRGKYDKEYDAHQQSKQRDRDSTTKQREPDDAAAGKREKAKNTERKHDKARDSERKHDKAKSSERKQDAKRDRASEAAEEAARQRAEADAQRRKHHDQAKRHQAKAAKQRGADEAAAKKHAEGVKREYTIHIPSYRMKAKEASIEIGMQTSREMGHKCSDEKLRRMAEDEWAEGTIYTRMVF